MKIYQEKKGVSCLVPCKNRDNRNYYGKKMFKASTKKIKHYYMRENSSECQNVYSYFQQCINGGWLKKMSHFRGDLT